MYVLLIYSLINKYIYTSKPNLEYTFNMEEIFLFKENLTYNVKTVRIKLEVKTTLKNTSKLS